MTAERPFECVVLDDAEALAEHAARWLFGEVEARGGRLAVCLTGGSTPERLYARLTRPPYSRSFPWPCVHWFFSDERCVAPDDERNNARMTRRALFDHVDVAAENIHAIPTQGPSPAADAAAYEAELKGYYGAARLDPDRPLFDVAVHGLGKDGHTASIFPGSPALDESERWVVPVAQARQEPYVPRITLTLPVLGSSRTAAFLVSGADKREPLARLIAGAALPAARVGSAGRLSFIVDAAAMPETAS